jgi:xylan 1,4-beta-xylosidase
MKSIPVILIALLPVLFAATASAQADTAGSAHALRVADPTIYFYKGAYYLFGTDDHNASNGFTGYQSKDLQHWTPFTALSKGASYGTQGFWAPQVFQYRKKFYMAYTADENIAIASSDKPTGPFTQTTIKQLDAPVKQIDPFVFVDDDGKVYLYHVRLERGNRIFVAAMKDDLSGIIDSTLKPCISGAVLGQDWENTKDVPWTVTEGPTVMKSNGKYYLFYSANDFRNPDYAVGYAVADSPYGPWQKYSGNPIISRQQLGIPGTGHGDFFTNKKGELWYVLHTHDAPGKVGPRKTAMIKVSFVPGLGPDKVIADPSSFRYLPE